MAKAQKKRKKPVEKPAQLFQPKDFLDRIAPAAARLTDKLKFRIRNRHGKANDAQ